MFRPSLRPAFLLAILLLAAPSSARAAVDVQKVSLSVTIAHSSVSSDSFEVALVVTGTELNNGTLSQLPAGPAILLDPDPQGLVYNKTYNSAAALDAAWPNGSYLLSINAGSVTSTLVYTRPLVPDPAISQPDAGGTVAPGSVELQFTSCGTFCNGAGGSVEAVLASNTNVVLAQETLAFDSDSWTPQAAGGALQLSEQSTFAASVTHTGVVETFPTVTGDPDLQLLFSNSFVRSDEIGFDTGFDSPSGSFCLAANHAAAPVGCTILSDPTLEVLDTSGPSFVTQVDGHVVEYSVSVADDGKITGSATADLDDNGSQETGPSPIKGKLRGKSGEVKSKLSFSLENTAPPAKFKVKMSDLYTIPTNSFEGKQTASGSINGVKLGEELLSSGALPFPPLGWLLRLDIDAAGAVQNALLTLESGRSFPLSGTSKFKFSSGESRLKLESSDRGIRINLRKIRLDDATNPMGVSGGDVSPRILGQRAKALIP